jgi:hypothetical protein
MAKRKKVREGDRVLVNVPYYNGSGTVIKKYRVPRNASTSYDIQMDDGRIYEDGCILAFRLLPHHMSPRR